MRRFRFNLCTLIALCNLACAKSQGSSLDPEDTPTTPTADSLKRGAVKEFLYHDLKSKFYNFSLDPSELPVLKPSCLKKSGVDLIILDPGHDDTPISMRSEGRDKEDGPVYFARPTIHEGNLNFVSSWFVIALALKHPGLNLNERLELESMLRLSRHPGEKIFGHYETKWGYSNETQGELDSKVGNRRDRVNFMMNQHRPYNPSAKNRWGQPQNVADNTLMLSVHGNNSGGVYDEDDIAWTIVPWNLRPDAGSFILGNKINMGLSLQFKSLLKPGRFDSKLERTLKENSIQSYDPDNIVLGPHSVDLAMLRHDVGTSRTVKLLLEGFMMTGKVGHLAHLEMSKGGSLANARLSFETIDAPTSYRVSSTYLAYAQSIYRGIWSYANCGKSLN